MHIATSIYLNYGDESGYLNSQSFAYSAILERLTRNITPNALGTASDGNTIYQFDDCAWMFELTDGVTLDDIRKELTQ